MAVALTLPFSVALSCASSGPSSEEAGWKMLGRNGKSWHDVLLLFAKEIYAFVICVVPENSKGVITLSDECQGWGIWDICAFATWKSTWSPFVRMTACVWSAQNAISFHVCLPLDFAHMSRQQRFFPVFLVLALLVAKALEEEVLLGWGKVCHGSSCPTRLVPVDCSTQREARCCLHPCLGH